MKREKREDDGDRDMTIGGGSWGEGVEQAGARELGYRGGVETSRMKCDGVCRRKCHADKGKNGVTVIKMH